MQMVAESLYNVGEHDSAGVLFSAVLDSARAISDEPLQARALTWLGLTRYRLDDFEGARRIGREALDLKIRLGLNEGLFQSYNALGLVAWQESRYTDAAENFRRAIAIAEAQADTLNLSKVWTNLALVVIELGDFPQARRLLTNALTAATRSGDERIQGRVLTNLGMLDVRTGAAASALVNLRRARVLAAASRDYLNELNVLGQLASAHGAIGQPGTAIAHLDTALRLAREPDRGSPLEEASSLAMLAEAYVVAGDHVRALRAYEESIALDDSLGLPHEKAGALREVAAIHGTLGNMELADRAVSAALETHRELGTRLEVLLDLVVLAELKHRAGRRAEVSSLFSEARRIAADLAAPAALATIRLSQARVMEREGRPSATLSLLAGLESLESGVGRDRAWEVEYLRMRANLALGRREAALVAGRRSIASIEQIRGEYGAASLRTSYVSDRNAVFGEVANLHLDAGQPLKALEVAEAARGQAIAEYAATVREGDGPTARELAEEERVLLRQIDTLTVALADLTGAEGSEDLLIEQARTRSLLERTRSAFDDLLVRSRTITAPTRAQFDVESIRHSLSPDEALVEFLVTDAALLTFVITSDTVDAARITIRSDDLAARVRVARELARKVDAPPTAVRATFGELGQLLLGNEAVRKVLTERRRLIVVAHADLVYVPFAALIDPRSGRYFSDDVSIQLVPSAGLLPLIRNRPRHASAMAAAFAPFPAELPFTAVEARAVRPLGLKSRATIGRGATERAVRSALESAAIVHVSTHGVLNSANPLFSRLELVRGRGRDASVADDGRLEVHEILTLSSRSSLVFLSGCETGVGGAGATMFARGDDYTTLAQAFLVAGANNVIATLWQVQDEAAAAFAARFYEALDELGGGAGTLSDALTAAQRSIRADLRFAAPYFWAGYALNGSGEWNPGPGSVAGSRATFPNPSVP
jgi:CHAT domain-containing protein/Tfp pilus assembly protein PilF